MGGWTEKVIGTNRDDLLPSAIVCVAKMRHQSVALQRTIRRYLLHGIGIQLHTSYGRVELHGFGAGAEGVKVVSHRKGAERETPETKEIQKESTQHLRLLAVRARKAITTHTLSFGRARAAVITGGGRIAVHTAVRSEVPAVAGALSSGMITSPVTRAPIRARF